LREQLLIKWHIGKAAFKNIISQKNYERMRNGQPPLTKEEISAERERLNMIEAELVERFKKPKDGEDG
jgi:hypothetical protein